MTEERRATPKEIYEVLEQQKKLQAVKDKLTEVMNKIKETVNSITVENLQMTSSQIESIELKEEANQNPVPIFDVEKEDNKRAEQINQQIIDLEMNYSQDFMEESDDDDH